MCARARAQSTIDPKNNRSTTGQKSGNTIWKSRMCGSATRPSVP